MARTRAQENRKIRQDALREQLAGQKLVEKVIDNVKKMEELDPGDDTSKMKLDILKASNADRHKLIDKYLPNLKQTELVGDPDSPLNIHTSVSFVGVSSD
jgi:hypothetical protein